MASEIQTLKLLGKNIKTLRKSRGLTQEELAELCDFDPTYISLLETGRRNPPFLTLVKLAKQLKSNVVSLVESL